MQQQQQQQQQQQNSMMNQQQQQQQQQQRPFGQQIAPNVCSLYYPITMKSSYKVETIGSKKIISRFYRDFYLLSLSTLSIFKTDSNASCVFDDATFKL